MSPSKYCRVSKEWLHRKYVDEGWAEKLRDIGTPTEIPCGNFKMGYVWTNAEGDVFARLFEHINPKGNQTVVRQLRDGDTMYYIP
jgi:hypothetical protein